MSTKTTSSSCTNFWSTLSQDLAAPVMAPQALAPQAGTMSLTQAIQADAAETGKAGAAQLTQTCCPPPDWMPIALGEEGVSEYAGAKMNPRIAEYFKASKFWGTDDSGKDNAWCASLVAYVMKTAGYDIAREAFRAREWSERWPEGKNAGKPVYGAIAVKTRKGGGHVGFVVGKVPGKPGFLAILGGNQSDTTNVAAYPESDFHAFMLPKDYNYDCCVLEDYTGKIVGKGTES